MSDIDLDKRALAYGPITKYFDIELFNKDLEWYRAKGYKLYQFDASKWYTIEDFHSDCHEVFQFPGYYGRNWGAFDDVIPEIDQGHYGNVLVAVTSFDSWFAEDSKSTRIFLDIMSDQTYSYLLSGRRFITLIQSNDPRMEIKDIGAKSAMWNLLVNIWDRRLVRNLLQAF